MILIKVAMIVLLLTGCHNHNHALDALHKEQEKHAKGACGDMPVGTGLTEGVRGEVASMLPGMTKFRVKGNGNVYVSFARLQEVEFSQAVQFHTIRLEGTDKDSVLEWKVPGAVNWEPVDKVFLYPRKEDPRQAAVDKAIATGSVIPGTGHTAAELKDIRRVVQPENKPEDM